MSLAAPDVIVEPFCAAGTVGVDYTLIPVPSQVGVSPELASFATGFPPATRTPRNEGGIPPRGLDVNGVIRMATAYCAWLQGGGWFSYDAAFVANNTGYAVGIVLQSLVNPALFFRNTLANNAANPDSDLTGWVAYSPSTPPATPSAVQSSTLAAGSTNNLAIANDVGFLEITANAAGSTLTGMSGGFDGQIVVATNVSVNALTFAALTGSTAGNQLRLPTDITVLQYGHVSFRKSVALNKWIPMS